MNIYDHNCTFRCYRVGKIKINSDKKHPEQKFKQNFDKKELEQNKVTVCFRANLCDRFYHKQ